jgi:hypothetical protein
MTYTPPGQEPQQPSYSTPQQSGYSTPQYSVGQQSYSGYAAPAPKSDKKTFGLWALILGLSGFLLPFFINSIAAIALGIVGLLKENSKGMSITGIVTGAINLLIWGPIVWFVIVPGIIFLFALGAAGASTY